MKKSFLKNVREILLDDKRQMKWNTFFSKKETLLPFFVIIDLGVLFLVNVGLNLVRYAFLSLKGHEKSLGYVFFQISKTNIVVLLVVLLALVFANIVFAVQVQINYKEIAKGQKRSSRFATKDELIQQYPAVDIVDGEVQGFGGVPIARIKKRFLIETGVINYLITGMTQSGKGQAFVMHVLNIFSRATSKRSLIITDPKGELFASSATRYREKGYLVYSLNLKFPEKSMGFNPFHYIIESFKRKDWEQGDMLTANLVDSIYNSESERDSHSGSDPFWSDTSISLLSALTLSFITDMLEMDNEQNAKNIYEWKRKQRIFLNMTDKEQSNVFLKIDKLKEEKATLNLEYRNNDLMTLKAIPLEYKYEVSRDNENKINFTSLINLFQSLKRKNEDEETSDAKKGYSINAYFENRPVGDRSRTLFSSISESSNNTYGSIVTSMLSKLKLFAYPSITKMTSRSTIDFRDIGFGDKPIAVFLISDESDNSKNFIFTLFISQLYYILNKTIDEREKAGERTGKVERNVTFLLDEFANIPPITNIDNILTMCLGKNIQFILFIQNHVQLEITYSLSSRNIMGNCGYRIFILTADLDTATEFSSLLGEKGIVDISRSGKMFDLNKTITETNTDVPLLDENELMQLKIGENVVFRPIKRLDLKNNKIKSYPIFNNVDDDTDFPFAYKEIGEFFPSNITVSEVSSTEMQQVYIEDIIVNTKDFIRLKQLKDGEALINVQASLKYQLLFLDEYNPLFVEQITTLLIQNGYLTRSFQRGKSLKQINKYIQGKTIYEILVFLYELSFTEKKADKTIDLIVESLLSQEAKENKRKKEMKEKAQAQIEEIQEQHSFFEEE